MRRLTTKEFTDKANKIHSNKYGYGKVVYVNNLTKITVVCPVHSDFEILPSNHLVGNGCKPCSHITRRVTTKEFVKRSKAKHGDKFNYDKSEYVVGKNIIITCSVHGDFETSPHNHMNGHGCFKCRTRPPCLENEEYIRRAIARHGDKFDYSKTKYIKSDKKIIVICKTHGVFNVYPADHIAGNGGCKLCMVYNTKELLSSDTDTFIAQAIAIHGDTYDYSNVSYVNNRHDVTIICSKHGEFKQGPKIHLRGGGCFKCSVVSRRDTLEDFKEKAVAVHKNRYNYDKAVYVNTKTPITIICNKHGVFSQTPNSHLAGTGCPICNTSKGEAKVVRFLTKYNIKYVLEYNISGDNRYRYDFYLTDLTILIEYDGIQHFKPIEYFGGRKGHRYNISRDKAKNELAAMHNIPLIRIPYTEYGNLADYLLFKLSKIYKYRDGDNWYKSYLELCIGKQLPKETTPRGVRKYLTYKKK